MLTSIQQQVVTFTKQLLNDAVKYYKLEGFDVDSIDIKFDLKGKVAGQAVNYKHSFRPIKIRYHNDILNHYGFDDYKNTIIHECAHLIADYKYKSNCNHNRYWEYVCKFMGGTGERCHNYDISVNTRVTYHSYQCNCRVHSVSTRLHNIITSGKKGYRCKSCSGELKYKNS